MQIVLDRDVLAEAVAWTARALPARPVTAVLAGIRLQAGADGTLELSSFDYDVSAHAAVAAGVAEPGSALVPGRLLSEISRSLPARPVRISVADGRAVLTCGSSTFTLQTMPEEEYPALPEMPEPAGTVGSDAFATAVTQSATAAGRDDTLPALTGVRLEIDGDTLTMVSTDRYRLAIRELRWSPARPGLSTAVLVPARALTETARSLTASAEVAISLALPDSGGGAGGDGMIGFEGAGRRTTTRLLGGEFPRIQSLLPTHWIATADLPVAPLTESVRRVALVADKKSPVRLSFGPGQLMLEAGAGDEAQAEETMEAEFTGEEPLSMAFNPQYLLDGLSAVDSDTVRISFTVPGKPALLTGKPGEPGETAEFRYLLMPIRQS